MTKIGKEAPLVAIVGPTASGKTDLSLKIAQRFDGEIICADSRTVYKYIDIGTAKPSLEQREAVPHHLLDVAEPNKVFTVADFQQLARRSIEDISKKGRLPVLVGGTGLYVDAVLYDYQFPSAVDTVPQAALYSMTLEELQNKAASLGLSFNQSDWHNPRRLVRAIETAGRPRSKSHLRPNTLIIGLNVDAIELRKRIERRAKAMLQAGLMDEVGRLVKKYGADISPLQGAGYAPFLLALNGDILEEVAVSQLIRDHIHLAKRQLTWFKRNPDIVWVGSAAEAEQKVKDFLREAV